MMMLKASLLARAGDLNAALATADAAVAARSSDADLLDQRCWIKGN